MSNMEPSQEHGPARQTGVTMVELVIVLALFGLMMGLTALALTNVQRPLSIGAEMMQSQFSRVRTQAMANTTAYRIAPQSNTTFGVESALSCSAVTWTAEPSFDLDLPDRVTITGPMPLNWSVCFDTRGLASDNIIITLAHPDFGTQQVEVLLGGSLREL